MKHMENVLISKQMRCACHRIIAQCGEVPATPNVHVYDCVTDTY